MCCLKLYSILEKRSLFFCGLKSLSHHFLLQLESLVCAFLVLFSTTLQTGKLWSAFLSEKNNDTDLGPQNLTLGILEECFQHFQMNCTHVEEFEISNTHWRQDWPSWGALCWSGSCCGPRKCLTVLQTSACCPCAKQRLMLAKSAHKFKFVINS